MSLLIPGTEKKEKKTDETPSQTPNTITPINTPTLSSVIKIAAEKAEEQQFSLTASNSLDNNNRLNNINEQHPRISPSSSYFNRRDSNVKSPDEEFLHFAQIQALRDEELSKARQQLQQVKIWKNNRKSISYLLLLKK